jgi:hypothetical protein
MKNIFSLVVLFLVSIQLYGQKPKSTIRFSANDHKPIAVTLNDRDYNKIGRSITFKDIPRKRHHVRIYSVVIDDRTGQKYGTTLFSGNIKIEPGYTYDAILDIKTNKLKLNKVKILQPLAGEYINKPSYQNVIRSSSGINSTPVDNSGDITIPLDFEANLNASILNLKQKVEKLNTDKEKIAVIQENLKGSSVTAYEARAIVNWLLFDDNKLTLANELKSKVVDKNNISIIGDAFSLEATKNEFLK